MFNTIYLDKSIEHLGFGSRIVYDGPNGHVSLGGTASGAAPTRNVVVISAFGFTVVGVNKHIAQYRELKTDKQRDNFIVKMVATAVAKNPKRFLGFIKDIEREAISRGRAMAQKEMRIALGLY